MSPARDAPIRWRNFTEEELSAVLSLVANGEPFCCAGGRATRNAITPDRRKRRFLAIYGYEATGCSRPPQSWHPVTIKQARTPAQRHELDESLASLAELHVERWERYFEDLVEAIGEDHAAMVKEQLHELAMSGYLFGRPAPRPRGERRVSMGARP